MFKKQKVHKMENNSILLLSTTVFKKKRNLMERDIATTTTTTNCPIHRTTKKIKNLIQKQKKGCVVVNQQYKFSPYRIL